MEVTNEGVMRRELFEFLRKNGNIRPLDAQSRKIIIEYVENKLNVRSIQTNIPLVIFTFLSSLQKKWKECGRSANKLYLKYSLWLDTKLLFSFKKNEPNNTMTEGRGRPKKPFQESCEKTKKRNVKHLLDSHSSQELAFASRLSLYRSGKRHASSVIEEVTEKTPTRAHKFKKAYKMSMCKSNNNKMFSPEEALAILVDLNLTKQQYMTLRQRLKEKDVYVFPSYDVIKSVKKECYPPDHSIVVTESSAEIKLQAILNITTSRIVKVQDIVLQQCINDIQPDSIECIYKWGFDGSSGQREYKQKFTNDTFSDSNLLMTSLVPIQIHGLQKSNSEKIIIWKNPRPSSTKFCRPVRFLYEKETKDTIKNEVMYIENQINDLEPTEVIIGSTNLKINNKLLLTMIDGKVCNSITDTSSQVCYICGVSPKYTNNLELVKNRNNNVSTYSFGLSTLHAHIRFFECLMHISYRLEVKKWQMRSPEDKQSFKRRKTYIINRFRKEVGIIIDQPKQGCGSSNDGNTARRFFENALLSAEITGLNVELISRFGVILATISSGFHINISAFEKYAMDTAKLYIEYYNWYYMPASVHKILLHGADVIKHCLLPIGQLSEEASEARNKHYRSFREHFTRKTSRIDTNIDLLHRLIVTSDPVISSIRPNPSKKMVPISPEVLTLLTSSDSIPIEKTVVIPNSESE